MLVSAEDKACCICAVSTPIIVLYQSASDRIEAAVAVPIVHIISQYDGSGHSWLFCPGCLE